MSRFSRLEQCPRCAEIGKDRSGDNLAVYTDGGAYCYSCGYYRPASFRLNYLINKEVVNDTEKAVLPSDFSRQIPGEYWQWLLQYELPMSYWKEYAGFSAKDQRLILTYGSPITCSVGRSLDQGRSSTDTVGRSKWKVYGNKTTGVTTLSRQLSKEVVLVEDLISAHKVAQVTSCIPLFGTDIFDKVLKEVKALNRPVTLWLDEDQYSLLPRKINRLQSLLELPVRYVTTPKDPKSLSIEQITEKLM